MDTSKSHRKRLRRNRNVKYKSGNSLISSSNSKSRIRKARADTTKTKVPDIDMPNQEEIPQSTIASDEELLNNIAANITANETSPSSNVFVSEAVTIPSNEIFFADEIPQCITDDIVLSSSCSSTIVSSAPVVSDGPSVIVEYLPTMDTFDENELNGLINLNEQELIDRFLNCGDDHEIFVN